MSNSFTKGRDDRFIQELIRIAFPQYAEAKRKVKEAQDALASVANGTCMREISKKEEGWEQLAALAYYFMPEAKTEGLIEASGQWSDDLKRIAAEYFPLKMCGRCGSPLRFKRGATFDTRGALGECKPCQQRISNQRDTAWKKAQQERDARLKALKSMPYREYLKTPEWNETRVWALKRARYRCQLCNVSDVVLHVHHRSYENLAEESSYDLIVLCADCHQRHHEFIANGDRS